MEYIEVRAEKYQNRACFTKQLVHCLESYFFVSLCLAFFLCVLNLREPLSPIITLTVYLHACLSSISRTASGKVQLYHSSVSSLHLLGGLPRGRVSSVMYDCLRQTNVADSSNNCNFLLLMLSTIVKCQCSGSHLLSMEILSFQRGCE